MKKSFSEDTRLLISILDSFHPLGKEAIGYIDQQLIAKDYPKGSLIVKAGEPGKSVLFIKKGLLRGYIKAGSRTITTWLGAENEIVPSTYGLEKNEPSPENIEALEDCQCLLLSAASLQKLYKTYPEFNITGRKIIRHLYKEAEKRAFIVRNNNAMVKYGFFLHHYPHLADRAPVKYISSFLGVAFETLSRVRKKNAGPYRL